MLCNPKRDKVYETEKEAMYYLSNKGNSVTLSYNDVLLPEQQSRRNGKRGSGEKRLPTFQRYGKRLLNIWMACKNNMDGHSRIEVRMNLKALIRRGFTDHFIELDLTRWFCAIPREDWWSDISI